MLSGYPVFDPEKIDQLRLQKQLTRKELFVRAGLEEKTGYRFFRRERVQLKSARRFFDVLGVSDFTPFLDKQTHSDLSPSIEGVGEWELEGVISPWITLANRLQFRICKLRHSILQNTWTRAKCYDLAYLSTKDDQQTRECLTRHPHVCRILAEHRGFLRNQVVRYSDDGNLFWVIDDWIDGCSLADLTSNGSVDRELLPHVMRQVAGALQTLHAHEIIRRELTPDYVFIGQPSNSVVLTELELAKLLDGSPTVSTTWDANPYRAPEVEGDAVGYSADLYSWAQILLYVATGVTPPAFPDPTTLIDLQVPPSVRRIVAQCLALQASDRPSIEQLIAKLKRWK